MSESVQGFNLSSATETVLEFGSQVKYRLSLNFPSGTPWLGRISGKRGRVYHGMIEC